MHAKPAFALSLLAALAASVAAEPSADAGYPYSFKWVSLSDFSDLGLDASTGLEQYAVTISDISYRLGGSGTFQWTQPSTGYQGSKFYRIGPDSQATLVFEVPGAALTCGSPDESFALWLTGTGADPTVHGGTITPSCSFSSSVGDSLRVFKPAIVDYSIDVTIQNEQITSQTCGYFSISMNIVNPTVQTGTGLILQASDASNVVIIQQGLPTIAPGTTFAVALSNVPDTNGPMKIQLLDPNNSLNGLLPSGPNQWLSVQTSQSCQGVGSLQ